MVYFVAYVILIGLTFLCFWLPYKSGRKAVGITAGVCLAVVLMIPLVYPLDFLSVFLFLFFVVFSLVFILYWVFRMFSLPKTGIVLSSALFLLFAYIGADPWIQDWRFGKSDAIAVLEKHGFEISGEAELLSNESGGFRDYYHTFELQLSGEDYEEIQRQITNSGSYIGKQGDDWQVRQKELNKYDTLNYETEWNFVKEYFTKEKLEDGTFHFVFQLSKFESKLKYIGSDE